MSAEPIEILVAVHFQGRTGVVVSTDGDGRNATFVGNGLIKSFHETGRTTRGNDQHCNPKTLPMANMTVPEWFATKKGLV